ncbi:MAG: hypothetical protein A2908_03055 [Candidatus Staskawiczbacteria bacterium RIFCSPLOWO2_01_FULL_38_12b]|uniref:Uncharacterized protein n=1 Tax=Candidatus Staskawiczbacteria bacterium RIFCSPLOWO2_01_FULL_38_12b TaxID=1802214 RepID=A0A1G2ICS3_9BACT|nr:MAG: hypothetical protein A2908_03055 [Candidatus Staskawiczbacteria bacterium RIFCSPLOWO2_01_FULL_38_12b]QBM02564.1 hypothetical protein [uncultured archaeon]
MWEFLHFLHVAWWNIRSFFSGLFGRTYKARICGHSAKFFARIEVDGQYYFGPLKNKNPDYCHECLAGMSMRCVLCGKPILIGDSVTLFVAPEAQGDSLMYQYQYKGCLIGCWQCVSTSVEIIGRWVTPGEFMLTKDANAVEAKKDSGNSLVTPLKISSSGNNGQYH